VAGQATLAAKSSKAQLPGQNVAPVNLPTQSMATQAGLTQPPTGQPLPTQNTQPPPATTSRSFRSPFRRETPPPSPAATSTPPPPVPPEIDDSAFRPARLPE
jgi:hypothetical protein